MTPYFVVLIFSVLFMYGYQKSNDKLMLFIVAIIMIGLVGFRDASVGTDTASYCRSFLDNANYALSLDTLDEFSTEPGWNLLNLLLVQLGQRYFILLTAVGAICSVCALYVINQLSAHKTLTLFIYITLAFYLFAFAASRQAVAISIYMLSLPYLVDGDFKRYALYVLLAATMHQTAIIALPLYFFFRIPYSVKTLLLMVVGGLVTGFLIPRIMAFAATVEDRYAVYTEYEGGGEMFTVFYLMMAVFFIVQRKNILPEYIRKYDILLNMLLLGSLIYLVVTLSGLYGEVTRFAAYFQISIMFLWAEIYVHARKKIHLALFAAAIACHVGYYYIYLSKIGGIIPYLFNVNLN